MATMIIPTLDASGNGNNWTANNINYETVGSTYDLMTDVPTLTNATASNFATLNPVSKGTATTLSNANLNFTNSAGSDGLALSTIGVSSGKWYCEVTALGSDCMLGVTSNPMASGSYVGALSTGYGYYQTGSKYNNGSATAYGSSYTTNDVIGIALDLDAGTLVFYKNNVSQGTAFSGLSGTFFFAVGNGSTNSLGAINFGQRPFAYTPPTGYVALNTFNLPTPTIGATASSRANKYMDATLYTGNGSTQSIVNDGGFQPDFVWQKRRNGVESHYLVDAVRGGNSLLKSESTAAENTSATWINSFNSNGFTTNSNLLASGGTYVGWQWKANGTGVTNTSGSITSTVSANTTSGFSVVTYTETSGSYTVGHGLGVAPAMIILKERNIAGNNWVVWQKQWTPPTKNGLYLNSTAAQFTTGSNWLNSASSTTFGITAGQVTSGTANMVAYCFSEIAGFSKFGSYTGNGSSDGTFVYTGFRPRYIMIKNYGAVQGWCVVDTATSTYNLVDNYLQPNSSAAQGSGYAKMDILSNGFKLRDTDQFSNGTSAVYIYMAFAENPFKYSLAR